MMKSKFAALGLIVAFMSSAIAAPVGIASGAPSGTNYPMAEDIVKVCSTPNSPIKNVRTEGGLENIFKISEDKTTQYGVVPVDTLVYQQGNDPNMMKKIMMVFPFFSTEIHLVVRDGAKINSLADLAGKRVVEGPDGSATWVTVQLIKAITKTNWSGYKMSQSEGLKAVQDGLVDAEFVVAGKPITMLTKAQGIKLVPITHPGLDNFKYYNKTMIAGGTYPFQKNAITTYKIDNVLATYAFKNQYQKEIGELVTCITKNMSKLQSGDFHPKWRTVDPTEIDRIQWPAHPAAVAAIKQASK